MNFYLSLIYYSTINYPLSSLYLPREKKLIQLTIIIYKAVSKQNKPENTVNDNSSLFI